MQLINVSIILLFTVIMENLAENQTTFSNNLNNILLSRKKRFLLYPAGSSILVTMQFTKALARKSPNGINLCSEMDFYYELPNKISDYFLPDKFKLKSVMTEVPPTPSMPPNILPFEHDEIIYSDPHDLTFIPSHSDRRMDKFPTLDYIYQDNYEPKAKFWKDIPNPFWVSPNKYPYYNNNNYKNQFIPWMSPTLKKYSNNNDLQDNKQNIKSPSKSIKPFNIENYKHWQHFHGHKERRDIYSHMETLTKYSGVHPKTCILRMVCEAKHYLLPPGRSLFNDILQILFTIPIHEEQDDEYSDAMNATPNECLENYGKNCPISILAFLLSISRGEYKY